MYVCRSTVNIYPSAVGNIDLKGELIHFYRFHVVGLFTRDCGFNMRPITILFDHL